jgi:hypothetical protein
VKLSHALCEERNLMPHGIRIFCPRSQAKITFKIVQRLLEALEFEIENSPIPDIRPRRGI